MMYDIIKNKPSLYPFYVNMYIFLDKKNPKFYIKIKTDPVI